MAHLPDMNSTRYVQTARCTSGFIAVIIECLPARYAKIQGLHGAVFNGFIVMGTTM